MYRFVISSRPKSANPARPLAKAAAIVCLLTAACAPAAPATAAANAAEAPLLLLYSERPPYNTRLPAGGLGGLVGSPVMAAFKKAGLRYELHESSPPRQLEALKRNEQRVCAVGLYKTPEREQFAKYTKAVSQDQSMMGLANAAYSPPPAVTLTALLADSAVVVMTKEGVNYGPYLEKSFPAMKAKRSYTGAEYRQIVKMITAGRATLSFFPGEEAQYYARVNGLSATEFKLISFSDMPAGEKRYILCSLQVPDAVIAQLNDGLPNR